MKEKVEAPNTRPMRPPMSAETTMWLSTRKKHEFKSKSKQHDYSTYGTYSYTYLAGRRHSSSTRWLPSTPSSSCESSGQQIHYNIKQEDLISLSHWAINRELKMNVWPNMHYVRVGFKLWSILILILIQIRKNSGRFFPALWLMK